MYKRKYHYDMRLRHLNTGHFDEKIFIGTTCSIKVAIGKVESPYLCNIFSMVLPFHLRQYFWRFGKLNHMTQKTFLSSGF